MTWDMKKKYCLGINQGINESVLPTVSDSAAPVGYAEPESFLGAH